MTTTHGLTKPKKTSVKLDILTTDPDRFQHRTVELDETQAEDLVAVLRSDTVLDPLEVWDAGDEGLIVVDGHHRLEAYKRAGWKRDIPVLIHSCSEAEAQFLTVHENAKPRLQMSQDEKSGWGWRVVCNHPELTAKRIAEGPVSLRQVRYMRKAKKKFEDDGIDVPETWGVALMLMNGSLGELDEDAELELRNRRKDKLKKSIRADLAMAAQRDPNVVMEVVQEIMGKDRFEQGVDWMGYKPMTQAEMDGEHLPF